MTWMFELYYRAPTDLAREARLTEIVGTQGGWLDYRESPETTGSHNVCLTYEFDSRSDAEAAAEQLRSLGEHVEGLSQYT
jgi:hypothetical protein